MTRCLICKTGLFKAGRTIVTLQRSEATIILKEVPAHVCDNCGEYYLSEDVTEKTLLMAEDLVRDGAELAVLRFV